MFSRVVFFALFPLVAAFGAAADAQSLKAARARDAEAAALARQAVYTRKVCGSDMGVEIDWASVGDWPGGLLVEECDKALGAIEAACRNGDPRAKSLKTFICAGDGAGARLRGGVFRYGASPDRDAFSDARDAFSDN